ncbi:MAG: DUF2914 domain-containing protein [Oligoflexia bacterium]|nr:DUF2914 domain-containing protein [Oligoflexia bacterium]
MLHRIDEPVVIFQQALYLVIAAYLIGAELIAQTREFLIPSMLSKVWKYREFFLHFLLGTLLNSYAIFYFKSVSAFTSMFFIVLLVALLIINEFKRFGKSQTQVHLAFLSLCSISYFIALVPIVVGSIGVIPFLSAVLLSIGSFTVYYFILKPKLAANPLLLKTHLLKPFAAIHIVFVMLYFANAIPPVPLSVKYMGIYHGAEKTEAGYELTYTRPQWKFWQHGDQTFLARPGDAIYCYMQIFSPTRFKDKLQVRWLYWDENRGWLPSDAIPLQVLGGREEGFRAVTLKNNFQPGLWRVRVETMGNQEIGRIDFDVVQDETDGVRYLHKDIF